MNDQFKEKRFSIDIDKILNGNGAGMSGEADNPDKADGQLLDLTLDLVSVDYSTDSKIKKPLLDGLLRRMMVPRRPDVTEQRCGELDDGELDKVAGGQVLSRPEQGCSLCGCRRGAAGIDGEACPDCGHPRVCHT